MTNIRPGPWWKTQRIEDNSWVCWRLGRRSLWLRRHGNDLAVASCAEADEVSEAEVSSGNGSGDPNLPWQRWIVEETQAATAVSALPALPPRPLVVRSQQPLTIAPKVRVRFYVGVPAVMRLELAGANGGKSLVLTEIPTIELSQTWYGEPTEGSLCLSLTSRARRDLEEIDFRPHRILYPLVVHNATDKPFVFERASLQTANSAVYHANGRLWSSALTISYRGQDSDNLLEVERQAPQEAATAELLTPAREPQAQSGGILVLAGLRGGWMSQ